MIEFFNNLINQKDLIFDFVSYKMVFPFFSKFYVMKFGHRMKGAKLSEFLFKILYISDKD